MPTYEVRRVKPIMVSVSVEADSEPEALYLAQEVWVEDARDGIAYEVKRQPVLDDFERPEPDPEDASRDRDPEAERRLGR